MIKEAYCGYEISKLLKEKGFDEECFGAYTETNHNITMFTGLIKNSEYGNAMYTAPTHQMACAWIRERGYHIYILYQRKWQTWGRIIQELSTGIEWSLGGFDSHERAVEAAIKYALEILI